MIKIVNKNNSTGKPFYNCSEGSKFDNPFKDEPDHIKKYEEYFYTNLNPDIAPPGFLENLDHMLQQARRREVCLGSDVYPKKCHCTVIKQYMETELNNDDQVSRHLIPG